MRSLALCLALALALAGGRAAAAPSPKGPASNSSWLIAGPFPFGALTGLEDGLDRDYLRSSGFSAAGEASAAPLRVGDAGSKPWKEAGTEDGVDFLASLGPASHSVAYAYREFYSASSRRASLKIGSDDGVRVWMNGELAYANHVRRDLEADEDAVTVSLAQGKNRILVKVSQIEGAWGFSLRLLSLEEDAKAAKAKKLSALVAYPDDQALPRGGTLRGVAMTKPAYYSSGKATIELLNPEGKPLASTEATLGERFSLRVPPDFSGPASIRARGSGPLAGLAAPTTALIVGDAASIALAAAAKARAASSGATIADSSPTLEFLAEVLEGSVPPLFGGFDQSILALSEIEELAAKPARAPRGLARYAYRSAVDGSLQPYSLYLPSTYDGSKRYGLVVALHGAGGNDYEMASSVALARPQDMLIVAPYGRNDLAYTSTGERDVMDVIDLVVSRYAIDPDKVYLTGRSMGGYGTWRIGQLHSSRFAAIASFAGWTSLDCLENLASTPVLAVHGDADTSVSIDNDAAAVERLKSIGGKVRFDVLPGVGHDALGAWTEKSGPDRLLDWFRAYKREAWPQTDMVRTTLARSGKGKWATILGLTQPLTISAIDARIVDNRHIKVDTQNVSAFELDLRHPSLAKGGRILVLADGVNLTADAGSGAARFELGQNGRFAPLKAVAPDTLVNGGSGYADLFDEPLRVVYGSQKRSRAADNKAVAEAIADWAGAAGAFAGPGRFEVIPDSALSPAIVASSSLLLVGWPDENAALAALAPRLPVVIKGSKAGIAGKAPTGSGLILVCKNPENPGRLVGVVALPMRGKAAVEYARSLIAPLNSYGAQAEPCGFGMPDVIVLDGSGHASWAGCFDWKWERLAEIDVKAK
jgi:predicted esterase